MFTVNLDADALVGSMRTTLCGGAGFGSIIAFPRRPERCYDLHASTMLEHGRLESAGAGFVNTVFPLAAFTEPASLQSVAGRPDSRNVCCQFLHSLEKKMLQQNKGFVPV